MDNLKIAFLIVLAGIVVFRAAVYIHKSFSYIRCNAVGGSYTLKGQAKSGQSVALLPGTGKCRYKIKVIKGNLRLNHNAYNPDGGTWSLPPGDGKKQHYALSNKGVYEFAIDVGYNYGEADRVELVNPRLWEDAEFVYSSEKIVNTDIKESEKVLI